MSESPITADESGSITLVGEGISMLVALTAARGLALKITRGMDLTRPRGGRTPLVVANECSDRLDWSVLTPATGIKAPAGWASKRTNAGALLDLVMFLVVVYGWEPSGSVVAALDEKKLAPALRKAAKVRAAIQVIEAAGAAAAGE